MKSPAEIPPVSAPASALDLALERLHAPRAADCAAYAHSSNGRAVTAVRAPRQDR
ncbi:hypothetical protein IU486_26830 [Streptomyces gardneri]|uniref:hypothetical protein n=1 Tax=Nocardia TaxID=1817 RepID=UPI00135CDFD0|nr:MULTISPECIES: hypothetical protein [Nocardia]MBF6168339.1 hypothetical protein [Streptomyces gardneri]MBF6205833.1 hypothetical protein [Streptomyces gardneri]UAK32181.1 hypothetical protein K8O92_31510 [Nocardia asteroides]